MSRLHRRLAALAVLAIGLKLLAFLYLAARQPEGLRSRDTPSYVAPVADLLSSGSFSVEGTPETLRTPGYPLVLAAVQAVTGDVRAAVPLQILLGAAAALMAWSLVRRRLSDRGREAEGAATAALVVTLVDPTYTISQLQLAPETVFSVLVLAGLVLITRSVESNQRATLLAGFLLVSLSAFVRPISVLLPYALALALLGWALLGERRHIAGAVVLAVVIHTAMAGAWMLRNDRAIGYPAFSTVAQVNLHEYIAAAALARHEGRRWSTTQRALRKRLRDLDLPAGEYNRRATAEAWEIIRSHPDDVLAVVAKGGTAIVLDPGTGELVNMLGLREGRSDLIYRYQEMSPLAFARYLVRNEGILAVALILGALWLAAVWLGVGAGMLRLGRRWSVGDVVLAVSGVYLIGVAAGANGIGRFRSPAVPILAYFAGIGLAGVVSWLHRRRATDQPAGMPAR